MNKTNLLITLLALVSITGGLFAQQQFNSSDASPIDRNIEPQLAEFKLPDLEGKQHSIYEWKDKIMIINFWATWCPPCLKEIPEFIKLQNDFSEKGIQFIGIAVENKQSVAEYIKSNPVNYPILIAGDEGVSLSQQLGNVFGAVPFTLIVNRNNQIIYSQPGEIRPETIQKIIKPLISN